MPTLLEQLLHDLLQRYRFLLRELMDVSPRFAIDILAYRDEFQRRVEKSAAAIEDLLQDPVLVQPSFARNIFHIYKRLAEFAQAADEGPVFALSRFSPRDLFLTRLVAEMCSESGFPHSRPICTALSTQYYCTLTGMDLLLLPHSEPDHLLGLPDTYHELGHIILFRNPSLLACIRARAQSYFHTEVLRAQNEGWPANSIAALEQYQAWWLGEWSIEFGCDLIATYICGPAFGWTNTRLCARLSPNFYEFVTSHPADASRTAAIILMLERLGFNTEAQAIVRQWEELRQTAFQNEPQEFHLVFPRALLAAIVEEVATASPSLGLRPFDPASMPTAKLLNDAWDEFLAHPSSYRVWEEARIAELRQRLTK